MKINQVTETTIATLVELLGEYQDFYNATPDYEHNIEFLQGVMEGEKGVFFLCSRGEASIGYVSLYFSYSSVTAKQIAILNDLYVREEYRGNGYGKELIDYAINHARKIGLHHVRWCTRINNSQAQKLYAKYEATKTDWFHYDLDGS